MAVIGTSCSGKTTLARELAALVGAEPVELDALHWNPNWEPRPADEFRELVWRVVAGDRWVVDGNYESVRDVVWSRATGVVWLDYPFPLVVYRALWRTLRRSLTRETLYGGNRESFAKAFLSRDSILLWVLTSFRRRRREYAELERSGVFPEIVFWRLRSPSETSSFLSAVREAGSP